MSTANYAAVHMGAVLGQVLSVAAPTVSMQSCVDRRAASVESKSLWRARARPVLAWSYSKED